MATSAKPRLGQGTPSTGAKAGLRATTQDAQAQGPDTAIPAVPEQEAADVVQPSDRSKGQSHDFTPQSSQREGLQNLLAFSALHQSALHHQKMNQKDAAVRRGFYGATTPLWDRDEEPESTGSEVLESQSEESRDEAPFALAEVLQLVLQRAEGITGADGVAIALAENDEIVLRDGTGAMRPDTGARIDPDSAFSGVCLSNVQGACCDDTEADPRVNLEVCRRLGARSIAAVPLCGRSGVIGLLEVFSAHPLAFDNTDLRHLASLAELVVSAMNPDEQDRMAASAQAASANLRAHALLAPFTDTEKPLVSRSESVENLDQSVVDTTTGENKVEEQPSQIAPSRVFEDDLVQTAARVSEGVHSAKADNLSHRPGILVPMACLAIALVIAAGLWWKVHVSEFRAAARNENARTQKHVTELPPPATSSPSSLALKSVRRSSGESKVHSNAEVAKTLSVAAPATLQALQRFPHVTGMQHSTDSESSTIVLDLDNLDPTAKLQYESHRLTDPNRIYFDLRNTQLGPALAANKWIDVSDALLKRFRVAQPVPGITRLVLVTGSAIADFSSSLRPNPYRLVIEVHPAQHAQ